MYIQPGLSWTNVFKETCFVVALRSLWYVSRRVIYRIETLIGLKQTHNVPMVAPIADFVISLGLDGRIASQGTVSDALIKDSELLKEAVEMNEITEKAEEAIDLTEPEKKDKNGAAKLVMAEEIALGHVSWPALKLYVFSLGGIIFWTSFISCMIIAELTMSLSAWFLGYWASQYEQHPPWAVPVSFYLSMYAIILICIMLSYSVSTIIYVFGSVRVCISCSYFHTFHLLSRLPRPLV